MKNFIYLILLLFISTACKKETNNIEEVTNRLKGQWNAFEYIMANGDTAHVCPYSVVFNYEHGVEFKDQGVYFGRYADDNLNPNNTTFRTNNAITGTWKVTDEHTITFTNTSGTTAKTFTILKLETNYLEVRDNYISNTVYRMRRE